MEKRRYKRFWNATFLALVTLPALGCAFLIMSSCGGPTRFGRALVPIEIIAGAFFTGAAAALLIRDADTMRDGQLIFTVLALVACCWPLALFLLAGGSKLWFLWPSAAMGAFIGSLPRQKRQMSMGDSPNKALLSDAVNRARER